MKQLKMIQKVFIAIHLIAPSIMGSSSPILSISKEDGELGRSLLSTNCDCSVDVSCTLDNSGVPCENNLKVKRSECTNGNKIPTPVTIRWKYCNEDSFPQITYSDKVQAKYKKWQKNDIFKDEPIPEKECVELESKKNINLCKKGAAMSMKYEGFMEEKKGSYCYAFKFLRVRKQWLPEGRCSLTANVQCKMAGGDKEGEDCSGNIIKTDDPNNCGKIDVNFIYTYCFHNSNDVLEFNENQTFAKIKGKEIKQSFDFNDLNSEEKCREVVQPYKINTCQDRTGSTFQVQGNLQFSQSQEDNCSDTFSMRVYAATQCQYDFIITEMIDPQNQPAHRLIAIYTPNCAGEIITKDLLLIKYKRGKKNPSFDNPISLKGLTIPDDGFMVFCARAVGRVYYGDLCDFVTMDGSAADSDGRDQVAIIEGSLDTSFEILDIFGKIGEDGLESNHDFENSRVQRKPTATTPKKEWERSDWIITREAKDKDADPLSWTGVQPTPNQPTKSPVKNPVPDPTKIPTSSENTSGPTRSPVTNPSPVIPNPPSFTPSPTGKGKKGSNDGDKIRNTPTPTPAPTGKGKKPKSDEKTKPPKGSEKTKPPKGSEKTKPPKGSEKTKLPKGSEKTKPPKGSEKTKPPKGSEKTKPPKGSEKTKPPKGSERTKPPKGSEKTKPPKGSRGKDDSDRNPRF